MSTQLTVAYTKLAKAVKRGTGTRLSAIEVKALYQGDDAMMRVIDDINYPEQAEPPCQP